MKTTNKISKWCKHTLMLLPAVALLAVACEKEKEDALNPFEGGDNHITSFVLTKGDVSYTAAIAAGTITMTVPENVNLNGATVKYTLCENAKILPDPATITDWESELQFRVTAYNGVQADYIYTVERSGIIHTGVVRLKTQAEVDAFGQGSYTVVDGTIIIDAPSGVSTDSITSLAPLASLKVVSGGIVVNAGYKGDLTAFEQLETVGELEVLSKKVRTVHFPKLTAVRMNMSFDQLSNSTSGVSKNIIDALYFPELTTIDRSLRIYYADSLAAMVFPKLQQVGEDIIVEGKNMGEFLKLQSVNFPELTAVGGTISLKYIDGLQSFSAAKLTTAGALSESNCTVLANIHIPALTTIGNLSMAIPVSSVSTNPVWSNLQFPALTVIEGTLSLTFPEAISLELPPALKKVGTLTLNFAKLISLTLPPLLEEVGTMNLTLPVLTSLTLPSSLKMGTLNATDIRKVVTFDVRGTEIGALSFGSNTLVNNTGMTLTGDEVFPGKLIFNLPTSGNNPATLTVAVEGIKEVGGLEIPVANNQKGITAVKTIDFSWLEQVTGLLRIDRLNNLETLNLSNLQSVGGLRMTGLLGLKTLNLSKLETVTADGLNFVNWWSEYITSISLPELTSVVGDLSITGMDDYTKLATVNFPKLTTIAGSLTITGDINYPIETLTTMNFGMLTSAAGVTINKIPNLKNFCSLQGAISSFTADKWSVTNCGHNPTYQDMVNNECSK